MGESQENYIVFILVAQCGLLIFVRNRAAGKVLTSKYDKIFVYYIKKNSHDAKMMQAYIKILLFSAVNKSGDFFYINLTP